MCRQLFDVDALFLDLPMMDCVFLKTTSAHRGWNGVVCFPLAVVSWFAFIAFSGFIFIKLSHNLSMRFIQFELEHFIHHHHHHHYCGALTHAYWFYWNIYSVCFSLSSEYLRQKITFVVISMKNDFYAFLWPSHKTTYYKFLLFLMHSLWWWLNRIDMYRRCIFYCVKKK